jgi:Mitochondrial carrier protein
MILYNRIVAVAILYINLLYGTANGVRIVSFSNVNTNPLSQNVIPTKLNQCKYDGHIEPQTALRIRGGDGTIRTTVTNLNVKQQPDLIQSTDLKSFLISLVAGSIAGALGIGIAYPLDTLKTKQQVMMPSTVSRNMFQRLYLIYKAEGIGGFYGGVKVSTLFNAAEHIHFDEPAILETLNFVLDCFVKFPTLTI